MNNGAKRIPTLITLDVHDVPHIDRYLKSSVELLDEMGIPATYFVPALIFEKYPQQVKSIPRPHQVACHGLFHTGEEDYIGMPPAMQREYIERATGILSSGLGRHPGAFRTPGFRISGTTLSLLGDQGYYADVSVNSGRLGITSTYSKENGWFLAPRLPYHPDPLDPFRAGELSIWEIPVSAIIVPFTSNTIATLGSGLSRVFAASLLAESRIRPKPIVYMSHPEDLNRDGPEHTRPKFNFKMLLPTERGIPFRQYLSAKTPEQFYRLNCATLTYLRKKSVIQFLTVEDYVRQYLRAVHTVA
jgi:peptidoglycan/xylan/chitin deacetylase (PgdA/CDA1 family)